MTNVKYFSENEEYFYRRIDSKHLADCNNHDFLNNCKKIHFIDLQISKNSNKNNREGETYNASDLYDAIKKQLEKVAPQDFLLKNGRMTYETLSLLLGQAKTYINRKRYTGTQIALDILRIYELSIKLRFNLWKRNIIDETHRQLLLNAKNKILSYFEKYCNLNTLKKYALTGRNGVLENHPNLKLNYFERIDIKEKAYWLGWLFAEGWISKTKHGNLHFGVGCKEKDQGLVKRYSNAIGFNYDKKGIREFISKKDGRYNFITIEFSNNEFSQFLTWHGFIIGKNKSRNIELPKLNCRELYLAFLLGYYDGDGFEGTSGIASGSIVFLQQIKEMFNIKNKIHFEEHEGVMPNGRIVKGNCYKMFLGADLYNEMLENYQDSLQRKRTPLLSSEDRIIINRMIAERQRKFIGTKEELKTLVWGMPLTDIADLYDVGLTTIRKYIKYWNIQKPPHGYWFLKEHRKKKINYEKNK